MKFIEKKNNTKNRLLNLLFGTYNFSLHTDSQLNRGRYTETNPYQITSSVNLRTDKHVSRRVGIHGGRVGNTIIYIGT